jgi:membrane-bound ClpP family serine protease
VVLELNTPGGEVFAAQKISDALKSFATKEHIPVIAFVNNWAISAGAMLAFSCRYIIAAPDACMGAAVPVMQTAEGMQEAPEKINSAFRIDFANRAAFFGRNPAIAKAMVDADVMLVKRNGCIMEVSESLPTDEIISPKGKVLTLAGEQMLEYGVVDALLPKATTHTPDSDLSREVKVDQTALVHIPYFSNSSNVPVITYQMDLKTRIVSFLALPAVSSALLFLAMVGFYFEFTTPGATFPGLVGATALFLLGVGSFAQESITWFEPLCIVTGILLLTVELMFFPTLGFLLFLGGVLLLVGLLSLVIPGITSMRYDGEALNAAGVYVISRLTWLAGSFLLAILFVLIFGRRCTARLCRTIGLVHESSNNERSQFGVAASGIPKVGDIAIVVATLRPSGKIEWNHQTIDAISVGQLIESGEKVKITEIRPSYVVVEQAGKL